MNAIVTFTAMFAFVLSSPVPEDTNGIRTYIGEAIESFVGDSTVEETDIIYWYFSRENPTNGIPVSRESISDLNDTSFTATRDTMFIVHGWQNTNTSPFITTVRQAIIRNVDVNIFVVDWSKTAGQGYIEARYSVADVGKLLGQFISTLVSIFDLPLSRTTLVGHSLGSHVAGQAGAFLHGKIAVVVGLDPAMPLFVISNVQDRLNRSDAEFVHVIHTNGGLKGFLSPLGHSDYYVNGGTRQPGCGDDVQGSCAHARAFEYYAESLGSDEFIGVACQSYQDFSLGLCISNDTSVMGTYHIDTRASGNYYLNTNGEPPYARGSRGL